jgi:signal transduction histidine kinase
LRVRTAAEFDGVLVEIRDNGPGIPSEIRDRIFEPFFTTKPVGDGTGLGLDTVYRIVQKHRGQVRVESEPGRTSFQVRLPFPRP